MQLPKRKSEITRRLKQTEDNYLTPAKIQNLKKQLIDLEINQRPAAIKEVQRTQEMGDLSENAAYQEAKFRLRRINGKITAIEEQLKVAIPIQTQNSDTVQIGSTIVLKSEDQERTYQIVGSQETNPAQGRISHSSPLGAALLGHRVRDNISLPSGQKFIIKAIQ
ncbi:GreA/GreB family elongation factor [Patescibacteria group bacterium]|nr:GreA/GreB family elongation factor [Patescibacteria group bacterium]MBU1705171.1 GreA/GreB family elongation factor [Patescibacteria group bacterium]